MTNTQLFNDKEEILELINKSSDIDRTKILISSFNELQQSRTPFYLKADELNDILDWKLDKQIHRQEEIRKKNTPENIEIITQAAFSVKHQDEDIKTELRLKILCTLFGVGIPVASAILTLCFPTEYSVIDFRNWGQLHKGDRKKTDFSIKEYLDYLKEIKRLASQYNLTAQEIDIAIWTRFEQPRTD